MEDNKRIRERHEYSKNILCFKCESGDPLTKIKIPFLFSVHDISYGGMGISCPNLIPVGSVLSFRLAEDEMAREFKVEVMWAKIKGQRSYLGVAFKDVVRDDIIFLYGLIKSLET